MKITTQSLFPLVEDLREKEKKKERNLDFILQSKH